MNLEDTKALAELYLEKHNLDVQGWKFDFHKAKRILGFCNYRKKVITLSKDYALLNSEPQILQTVLHEIAHALAGWGAGHGIYWKSVARRIGCDANRTVDASTINMPKGDWRLYCPTCGYETFMYRKPKRAKGCGRCSEYFNPNYLMVVSKIDKS